MILELRDAAFRYPKGDRDALSEVGLAVRPGEFHAVLGPNGSGKTTLVRLALGVVRPRAGVALVLDRPAVEWTRRDLARVAAVVAQREEMVFPQRVKEAVMLGRYPYLTTFGAPQAADREAVAQALAECDATELADRWLATLSGGEHQRVRLARALAQQPRLLVLDEPTVSLDLRHEMELFERVRALVDREGLAAVIVTHHVNLAARFADRVLLLAEGRPIASGSPGEVLAHELVERVFGWPVAITTFDARPQMIPLRRDLPPHRS